MDFVNFPQNLVYRQREKLDEFDIRNKNSLNCILESELFKLYRTLPGYKNYALSIFNTAYYVCMMALADYDPMRNFGDYLQRINEITQENKDQTALILSMVLIIIEAHKWKGAKVGIDNLALQIYYEIEKNDFIRYSFYEQAKTHYESRISRMTLSPTSEFKPRTIYYKLLADNYSAEDLNNLLGTDEEKVLDFIYSLGKNEEEQYTIATFMEDQMHPFFADGWRRKAFFDYIRSHIHTKFHGEEERAISDAEFEAQQEEDAINYLLIQEAKERIPELEAENKRLRSELERLNKEIAEKKLPTSTSSEQNNEQQSIINQQAARIKELETENNRLKTEREAIEKEKASLRNEKEKAVREKNDIISAIEQLEKEVADWKKKCAESRSTAESEISKLNIKLEKTEREKTKWGNDILSYKKDISRLEKRNQELEAQHKVDEARMIAVRQYSKKDYNTALAEYKRQNEMSQKQIADMEEQIKMLQYKLGNKTIPLSSLADGLKRYAQLYGLKEGKELLKSLSYLLMKEQVWVDGTDILENFFIEAENENKKLLTIENREGGKIEISETK